MELYKDIRYQIESGFIVGFQGEGLPSELIRKFTGTVNGESFSHVGILFWAKGSVFIVEAIGTGVRVVSFSYCLSQRPYEVCGLFKVPGLTDIQIELAIRKAVSYQNRPYGTQQLFTIGKNILTRQSGKIVQGDDKALICTELIERSVDFSGVKIVPAKRFDGILPNEQLSALDDTGTRFVLKHEPIDEEDKDE